VFVYSEELLDSREILVVYFLFGPAEIAGREPMKKCNVLELRPTQFAIGMLEVVEKIKEIKKLNGSRRKKWIKENPVPVVISPRGDPYIVDHHHFLAVAHQLGIRRVRVEVLEDLSGKRMSYQRFWNWMKKNHYLYPYCQFGEGPRDMIYLPYDIRGLADDPYRSLAWFVRKGGAYEKTDRNFAEFVWANFFRKKRLLEKRGLDGFAQAERAAMKLAQSKEAKKLPGWNKPEK
jgi:hypothetical protein